MLAKAVIYVYPNKNSLAAKRCKTSKKYGIVVYSIYTNLRWYRTALTAAYMTRYIGTSASAYSYTIYVAICIADDATCAC